LSGSGASVDHLPPREGDILHSCSNISRVVDGLGWKPLMELSNGLKDTYEWYSVN